MMQSEVRLISDEMSLKIIETAENLVTLNGPNNITVRQILKELDITNRVFYNRFPNIDAVLDIVYRSTIIKIRESLPEKFEPRNREEYFESITKILVHSLTSSYEYKMKFNHYIFANDSVSKNNALWWCDKIKELIDYGVERKYIKDVNSSLLSYSIWCFVRGYNADAVGRGLPKEEAVECFKYSFSFFMEGLKL